MSLGFHRLLKCLHSVCILLQILYMINASQLCCKACGYNVVWHVMMKDEPGTVIINTIAFTKTSREG